MEKGELKFILLTLCISLICLTILTMILCITLWEYRVIVGISLLLLLFMGMLSRCFIAVRGATKLHNCSCIQPCQSRRRSISLPGSVQLGDTTILVHDDEFRNGCQAGYLYFIAHYRGMKLTDDDLYRFFVRGIFQEYNTHRYNAGYVVGLVKGMLEENPTAPLRKEVTTLHA